MTAYDDYKDRIAGLHENDFIGQVVWYSINTGTVTLPDVAQWFDELAIPARYLPNAIKPADAFRKATNLQDGYKFEYDTPWAGTGHSARILIREVSSDAQMIERHIVRENVDARGKALSYDKVGEAVFYRPPRTRAATPVGGERVRFNVLASAVHPDEIDRLQGLVADITGRYQHLCVYLDGNAIRKIVREYTTDLNAVSIKPSGGVYFVHKDKRMLVDVVQQFVAKLDNGSTYHTLPLVDTAEQRAMLSDAFQSEVENDVEALLKDIAAVNQAYGADVPPDKYDALLDRYTYLITRSEEYTTVLGASQARAATAIEMALTACMDLAGRVKVAA